MGRFREESLEDITELINASVLKLPTTGLDRACRGVQADQHRPLRSISV